MNNSLTYKAKDGVEYKFTIRELTLGVKPLWNKINHCIKKEMQFFCNEEDLKNSRAIELKIAGLNQQLEIALIDCKRTDVPDRTEQDENVFQKYKKVYDDLDVELDNAKLEKETNPIYTVEMTNYVSGIISSIENALLNEENVKIYESTIDLLEGETDKLDLTDIECFNSVMRPAVVAFFLKNLNN